MSSQTINAVVIHAGLVKKPDSAGDKLVSSVVLLLPFLYEGSFIDPNKPNNKPSDSQQLKTITPVMWQFSPFLSDEDLPDFVYNKTYDPLSVIEAYDYILIRRMMFLALPAVSKSYNNSTLYYENEVEPFIKSSDFFVDVKLGKDLKGSLGHGSYDGGYQKHEFSIDGINDLHKPSLSVGTYSAVGSPNFITVETTTGTKYFFYLDTKTEIHDYYYPVSVPYIKGWIPFAMGEYGQNYLSYITLSDNILTLTRSYTEEGTHQLTHLLNLAYLNLKNQNLFHNRPNWLDVKEIVKTQYLISKDIYTSKFSFYTMFMNLALRTNLSAKTEMFRTVDSPRGSFRLFYGLSYYAFGGSSKVEVKFLRIAKTFEREKVKLHVRVPVSAFKEIFTDNRKLFKLAFNPLELFENL